MNEKKFRVYIKVCRNWDPKFIQKPFTPQSNRVRLNSQHSPAPPTALLRHIPTPGISQGLLGNVKANDTIMNAEKVCRHYLVQAQGWLINFRIDVIHQSILKEPGVHMCCAFLKKLQKRKAPFINLPIFARIQNENMISVYSELRWYTWLESAEIMETGDIMIRTRL